MEIRSFKCPNCSANLSLGEEIDTMVCKYCGCELIIEGQNAASIDAKVKIKNMNHYERVLDKKLEQERFKMSFNEKTKRKTFLIVICCVIVLISLLSIFVVRGNLSVKKQEEKLQAVVDEIMIDIENENFEEAYVKAESLYWESNWTSEGEEKWDATRKEIIKQIKKAEKAEKKEKNKDNLFDWFD